MKPVSPQEWMTHSTSSPRQIRIYRGQLRAPPVPLPGAAEPHVLLEPVAAAASPLEGASQQLAAI